LSRKDLIAKGEEQFKNFSWQKTAKQTLAIMESLV